MLEPNQKYQITVWSEGFFFFFSQFCDINNLAKNSINLAKLLEFTTSFFWGEEFLPFLCPNFWNFFHFGRFFSLYTTIFYFFFKIHFFKITKMNKKEMRRKKLIDIKKQNFPNSCSTKIL